MSLTNLIKQRRTVYQFQDKEVPLELVESFIEAAVYAPNHKLTEPWLFLVIGKKTQQLLAEIYAEKRALKNNERGSEGFFEAFEKSRNKFLSVPKMVFVVQTLDEDSITCKEDYAACSCAIQNFQLAAWEQKIGVQWSSGPVLKDKQTFEILGVDSLKQELIALLYMGYPKTIGKTQRKTLSKVIRHFD